MDCILPKGKEYRSEDTPLVKCVPSPEIAQSSEAANNNLKMQWTGKSPTEMQELRIITLYIISTLFQAPAGCHSMLSHNNCYRMKHVSQD